MLAAARCLLLALNILVIASPSWIARWTGGGSPWLLVTILVVGVNIAIVASWDRTAPAAEPASIRRSLSVSGSLVLVAGLAMLSMACRDWLYQILVFPLDSNRADMLVVIQAGIHRLLQGHNPYTMYNVPWPATLPYGPVMWAPLLLPALAHADIRFVTLIGFLFTPCVCGLAALDEWARARRASAIAWLAVLAAVVFSPDFTHFVSIGHTPAYWPLLGLLAWLVARERWDGAAIVSGLLIVARTTMVSIAPVVLIAVWYRDRPRFARAAALLAASFALPFLPFAIWDWSALKYALYGSYQVIVKGYVWTSTDWLQHTIGLTAPLLSHGWGRAIEAVQAIVMLGVYAIAAIAIRAGRRVLPWLGAALLAFSMTTLWPVTYIYLDVCVLWICAAAGEIAWTRSTTPARAWAAALVLSSCLVGITVWGDVPVDPTIDAGTTPARDFLYAGFSADEREGDITFAWINGTRAEVLIPRRSRRDATIDIVCEPHLPTRDAVQQLSASLNGTVIGTVTLKDGWQHVELPAPGRAWQIGVNELTLFLSAAVSPKELGLSDDMRRLSLAVDRLTVRTP